MESNPTNEEMTNYAVKMPNPNETAMVLVEVLIYAKKEEKLLLDALLENLKKQIDKLGKKSHLTRVLWHLNNGDKTQYEQIQWLKTESNSMFYVFVDIHKPVDQKYLYNLIQRSKKMRECIIECKKLGIKPRPQKEPDTTMARHSTMKDEFTNFEMVD